MCSMSSITYLMVTILLMFLNFPAPWMNYDGHVESGINCRTLIYSSYKAERIDFCSISLCLYQHCCLHKSIWYIMCAYLVWASRVGASWVGFDRYCLSREKNTFKWRRDSKRRGRKQQEHFWECCFADSGYQSSERQIHISDAQEKIISIVSRQRSVDWLKTHIKLSIKHVWCIKHTSKLTLEQANCTRSFDTDSCFSHLAVQTVKRRETLD